MPLDMTNQITGLTYQIERFTELRGEGDELFAKHWGEASADKSMLLNINWPIYEALENSELLLTVTARREGDLVGYVVYVVSSHLHYAQHIVAEQDVIFLDPSCRAGWIGPRMIKAAELILASKGVDRVTARVKLHVRGRRGRVGDLQPVYRRLGYRAVETVMTKRLR